MEVLYPHCAGLDVHKDTVVACMRHMVDGSVRREVRTFKTTTTELLALSDWLAAEGCTHVAMEATGVYWKPVWHILSDGDFSLVLANAAHVKNVPGRKTDVNDAPWLADLLAHGLIRGSFVPDQQTQEMRNLLRTRKQLVRERSSHVQRLQKTLEDANIKLDSAISDIMGLSGRAMIEALIAGESDPERLAQLAHRRIKAPPEALREALRGRVTRHHRFLLRLHLQQIDGLDAAITEIDREVDAQIEPFRATVQLLTTIPGIEELSACLILAEIGRDMSRFPTAGHLISWAGLCPRSDESAGKRRSTRMRKSLPSRRRGERLGSKPPWSSALGRRPAKKPAISRRSFIGCALAAAPKKRSARSPPRSSPSSTTCWSVVSSITISAPLISTAGPKPPRPNASSHVCKISAMPSRSLLSQHDRVLVSC
jgi:transposase